MTARLSKVLDTMLHSMAGPGHRASWQPSADVYRCPNGWLVKFELAGVAPDEVEVRLCGRRLTIRGSRRDRAVREDQRSYSMEISYNRFERTIELPSDVDAGRITTEYRDGMLLVELTAS